MLLLPGVLLALSGISGAGGIALTAKSVTDTLSASATNRFVQERNERNLLRFESCSKELEQALDELGRQRMTITKNFSVFIHTFEKIHNRPEFSKGENATFPEFDFTEIKNVAVMADVVLGAIGGAAGGSMLGAAAASGTTTAVMAIGKASTGAKIAQLSGAAKTKAALAALGGGAKTVGGGGMALGTMVLNAATLGVGVLVEGLAMAYSASVAKKQADKARDVLLDNEQVIQQAIGMQLEITCSAEDLRRASVQLCNQTYKKLVFQLKALVEKKNDWNDFSAEEKLLLDNNILIVQILHYLNNTPLYKVIKYNSEGEVEEVEPNTKEVNSAIKKAEKSTKGLE